MDINTRLISELRKRSSAGIVDCKKALMETNGDMEKALEYLRKQGLEKAGKKSDRVAGEGIVATYVHATQKVGAMVALACETDFVARNKDFQQLGRDLAMQVVASRPLYLSRDQVSREVVDKEKAIYREQLSREGKPQEMIEKIIEGKMDKYYEEVCLLEQSFIKDEDLKVREVVAQKIATIGENIEIKRFSLLEI